MNRVPNHDNGLRKHVYAFFILKTSKYCKMKKNNYEEQNLICLMSYRTDFLLYNNINFYYIYYIIFFRY